MLFVGILITEGVLVILSSATKRLYERANISNLSISALCHCSVLTAFPYIAPVPSSAANSRFVDSGEGWSWEPKVPLPREENLIKHFA